MLFVILWIVFGLVGAVIGQRKGDTGRGFVWGLLLGPIGWLLIALTRSRGKICPDCGEVVRPEAQKCRHCGADLRNVLPGRGEDYALRIFLWLFFVIVLLPVAGGVIYVWVHESRPPRQAVPPTASLMSNVASEVRTSSGRTDVALPTPYAPASHAFLADVKQSQALAVQRHPDLAVAGSAFNRKFLALYQQCKDRHDPRLDRSDWPERLADEVAAQ